MDSYSEAFSSVEPGAGSSERVTAGNGSAVKETAKGENGRVGGSKLKVETTDWEGRRISDIKTRPSDFSPAFSPAFSEPYPGSAVLNDRFNKMYDDDTVMEDAPSEPKPATAAKTKKKGTAAAIKAPKKKPGTGKKGGKSVKSSTPVSDDESVPDDAEKDDGDSADEESDHGPYCICRGPDDHRWMIQCECCDDWFHGECVNIDKAIGETLIQRYVCPNCTDGSANVTRYKKTCSLEGCNNVARIYNQKDGNTSLFCSEKHCEEWWQQLIATLPQKARLKKNGDTLTREDFMGLLDSSATKMFGGEEDGWKLGIDPFSVPPDFWSQPEASAALSEEESAFLSASAAARYQLAEEVVLTKKMQQLLDMANDRRKAAVAAKRLESDACGYDYRLDDVGVSAQFAAFLKSPAGEAAFKGPKLEAPPPSWSSSYPEPLNQPQQQQDKPADPATAGMCERRRCKPHAQWYNIFTKSNKQQIKELAAQAKEKLDAETRVRDAAAVRFQRKKHEKNYVRVFDGWD